MYSFFSLLLSPSFCQTPFSYIVFSSFHSIFFFFFDVLYALFSPLMFVFFSFRSLYSSLNSFLSVFNVDENNGYFVFKWNSHGSPWNWKGGGEALLCLPQPFLSRVLDGKLKKRRELFSSTSDMCVLALSMQLELYEYHLCSSVHTNTFGFIKINLVHCTGLHLPCFLVICPKKVLRPSSRHEPWVYPHTSF